jgi:hypothetical protein
MPRSNFKKEPFPKTIYFNRISISTITVQIIMLRGSKIQNKRKKLRVQINKPIVSKRDLKHKSKFHLRSTKEDTGKNSS